jgi:SSS family solute:Na+ symporter
LKYLDPWFGGIVLATLLISLVMTGAALTLGVSTIWSQYIYKKIFRPLSDDREMLWISRLMVVVVSVIVILFVTSNANTLILKWAFLSMALRGVTVFLPLLGAVFLKEYMSPMAGTLAVSTAPTLAVLWAFMLPDSIDPLYVGMMLSFVILFSGMLIKKYKIKI